MILDILQKLGYSFHKGEPQIAHIALMEIVSLRFPFPPQVGQSWNWQDRDDQKGCTSSKHKKQAYKKLARLFCRPWLMRTTKVTSKRHAHSLTQNVHWPASLTVGKAT
jgi:hypothetical protein